MTTVHASPIALWHKWRGAFWRILLSATGFGVLMSFVGAFALDDDPLALRTLYLLVLSWISALLDMLAYGIVLRVAWAGGQFWSRVLVAAVFVSVPMGLLIWASTWLFGADLPPSTLVIAFFNTYVITSAFIAAFVAPAMDTALRRANADALAEETAISNPKPGSFMERLPRHLRESELWALKAEDHYLLAITSRGEALIRLRMADALLELGGVEGAQTHRSWWIARRAMRGVKKGEGRVALTLPDGREVAVSRAYARELREAGWF